ncbi:hypothetical protein BdWA1_001453 [Babesia duncani]|uniref:RRM domain-containing protein n=1 Tax=Babesia duncani TaxID=323732 RepID=A0AAD9PP84_9APIC|nr:hypothetical protein BdWA1_001453 [Babesia duncani]
MSLFNIIQRNQFHTSKFLHGLLIGRSNAYVHTYGIVSAIENRACTNRTNVLSIRCFSAICKTACNSESGATTHNVPSDPLEQCDENELDLNIKQICKVSHRNFLLYSYTNLDLETVIKVTNNVLAAYQTLPKRKSSVQRKLYLQKFLKCLKKHEDKIDVKQLSRWFIACIDLLTCQDLYTMLRVRHLMNYDNSFETFRTSFGMESFESFSNIKKSKELEDKLLQEKAKKSKSTQRKLLMRHLKINKFKFLRDQNITKAVYEANIDWVDESVEKDEMDFDRFALIYNLPFVKIEQLQPELERVLSAFGQVRTIDILKDRLPPLTSLLDMHAINKKTPPPPKNKYSPLYAIVEFASKSERDALCSTHIRVFGLICCGRVVYPEFANYKHSLLFILYPPFRKMTQALQFVVNVLVSNSVESTCTITHTLRKRHGQNPLVVTGERVPTDTASTNNTESQDVGDVELQLTKLRVGHSDRFACMQQFYKYSLDPQWIVLRFKNFKYAFKAREKLLEALNKEPTSCVSFDTRRSIFHNGKLHENS